MNYRFPLGVCLLVGFCSWTCNVYGQSGGAVGSNGQPLEFVESTSPLPGGGVVTSIFIAGQGTPQYRQTPTTEGPQFREAALRRNPPQAVVAQQTPGNSVLNSNIVGNNQLTTQQVTPPATIYQLPQTQPTTTFQVPAASQIPSLGIPTSWDRSIRLPDCRACANNVQANFPQQSLSSIGQVGYFQGGNNNQTYTPLLQLQNFPATAYAGQGIFGSPKLYVEGQPVRNLLRYLIVP